MDLVLCGVIKLTSQPLGRPNIFNRDKAMSIIAVRLSKIKPSPTIAVSTKAKELQAAGKDVLGLEIGRAHV